MFLVGRRLQGNVLISERYIDVSKHKIIRYNAKNVIQKMGM